jgi:hypothetical protein
MQDNVANDGEGRHDALPMKCEVVTRGREGHRWRRIEGS